ncbi:MAG: 4Fe-4S dicluster domain-containing protein [Chloroflexi bacterium]|nr:4Fe-4S dicluster domain-containing protein [Chloroflexota bacterium]
MKGVICYYSGSGNTKLACRYIAEKSQTLFDLVDVVKEKDVDLAPYDVVGFATFTDFWGPPYLFQTFIEGLVQQQDKRAFVFNTYGALSGKTLRVLERSVAAKGFNVIAGHSLKTPECYPPMIAGGRGAEDAPNEKQLQSFDTFISELEQLLTSIKEGQEINRQKVRIGLVNSILPVFPRTRAREDMGEKYVDESLCTECGVCEKQCPYEAIRLEPKPVFDMDKCYGCWRCYNLCPEHAIYTDKFRGGPFYPRPNDQLKEKLIV